VIDKRDLRYGTIGFHLAGFVDFKGKKVPILYHVHNGQSEIYTDINPYVVNANLDWTPERVLREWGKGHFGGLRNGDFIPYAMLSSHLSQFFTTLKNNIKVDGQPFQIPYPLNNLDAWAEFLRFETKLVGEIYALSNYPPIIGGKIITLTIDNNEEHRYEIK
jgi:hypothetical protein